jgi:hypothetical protein
MDQKLDSLPTIFATESYQCKQSANKELLTGYKHGDQRDGQRNQGPIREREGEESI